MTDFLDYLNSEKRPILVFDGATGTSLQDQQLNADDYGGASLEGCNENLVLTSVSSVEKVHQSFLEAGCDVIETNTFGATSIVLDEYGIGNKAYEINLKAAQIARNVSNKFQAPEKPRFVAGSIGPTTKLPTLGHISFDELKNSYFEQAKALIEGGIDLFIIETCQDVLQIKAALQSVNEAIGSGKRIPLMVSVTMETTGQMLIGSDISSITTIMEPLNIDILGLNCATGPEEMKDHIKYLSEHSPFHISCIPNAGLPENVGGKAHYRLTPMELKFQLSHFINDLGVQLIGGCCGTRPEHIKQLSDLSNELLSSNKIENDYLREFLNFQDREKYKFVGSDVISRGNTSNLNTILIDTGFESGVKKNNPVLSSRGVVGKIIASSANTSVVQLISDGNFRLSVRVMPSESEGILRWRSNTICEIFEVKKTSDINIGDSVVTSNLSTYFPPDLPIGKVISIHDKSDSFNKVVRLELHSDLSKLNQLFVIIEGDNQ